MNQDSQALATGCYGKLPARGDFLARRLSPSFVDPWDAWLQLAMQAGREFLGENWLDCYLSAPIWRFVLAPGVAGNQGAAGVFLPSVDRVGRYFPFTIASVLTTQRLDLVQTLIKADPWFESLEQAAMDALSPTLDVEAFEATIESLFLSPALLVVAESGRKQGASSEDIDCHAPMADEGSAEELQRDFGRLLAESEPGGVWLSRGSEVAGSHGVATRGLPTPQYFASMLDGDWQRANHHLAQGTDRA